MQDKPVSVISAEGLETESAIMEPPAPISLLTESSSLSHTETMYVSSDGTEACTVASTPDSMLPEPISAVQTELLSTKLVAEAGFLTSMEAIILAFNKQLNTLKTRMLYKFRIFYNFKKNHIWQAYITIEYYLTKW